MNRSNAHQQVKAAVEAAGKFPCVLCGRPPAAVICIPLEHPENFAAPPGSGMYFSLCADCMQKPLDPEKIEAAAAAGEWEQGNDDSGPIH